MTDLTSLGDGVVEVTRVGLRWLREPTLEEWSDITRALGDLASGVMWCLGDAIRYGEMRGEWGEMYTQVLEGTPYSYQTLMNAAWLAGKYPDFSNRLEKLPWAFHQVAASRKDMDAEDRQAVLKAAVDRLEEGEPFTQREFQAFVRRYKLALDGLPEIPEGTYRVIYADPPWHYDQMVDGYGAAEAHYPTMETPDIMAMPVEDRAAPDSVLFLWSTVPKLEEALGVMAAWGFAFRAMFVWDKVLHNYGHYNSVRHEMLLVGRRGQPPQVERLVDSVVELERTSHSRKPERFREIIDEMYPPSGHDRIELFARGRVPDHWAAWGYEAEAAA
jgi:N6-adenosine-specific RNA methylase IME4